NARTKTHGLFELHPTFIIGEPCVLEGYLTIQGKDGDLSERHWVSDRVDDKELCGVARSGKPKHNLRFALRLLHFGGEEHLERSLEAAHAKCHVARCRFELKGSVYFRRHPPIEAPSAHLNPRVFDRKILVVEHATTESLPTTKDDLCALVRPGAELEHGAS